MANIRKVTANEVKQYVSGLRDYQNAANIFNAIIFNDVKSDYNRSISAGPLNSSIPKEGLVVIACAICGNIKQESGFHSYIVDYEQLAKFYSSSDKRSQIEKTNSYEDTICNVCGSANNRYLIQSASSGNCRSCWVAHRGIFQTSFQWTGKNGNDSVALYARKGHAYPLHQFYLWRTKHQTSSVGSKNTRYTNAVFNGKNLNWAWAQWKEKGLHWLTTAMHDIYEKSNIFEANMSVRYNYANKFAEMANKLFGMKIKKIKDSDLNTRVPQAQPAFEDGTTPPTPSTPAPKPQTPSTQLPQPQTPSIKPTIIPTPSVANGTTSISSICEAIINHKHVDYQNTTQQVAATTLQQTITAITPDNPRTVETFAEAKPTTQTPTANPTTNNNPTDVAQYTKIKIGKSDAWQASKGKNGAVFLVGDSQMNTIAGRITLGSTYFSYSIAGDGFDLKDKIYKRVANGELPWYIEDKSSQSQSQAKSVDKNISVQSYGYKYNGTINVWGSSNWGDNKTHYVRLLGADGQVKQILKQYKPSKIICWCGHNTADANKKLGSVKVAELLYNHYTTLARYIKSNSPRTKFYIFPIAEIHQYKWSNSSNPNDWFYNIANAKLRSVPNATFVGWPSAWGSMDAQVQAKDPHIQWIGAARGKAGSWLAMCT